MLYFIFDTYKIDKNVCLTQKSLFFFNFKDHFFSNTVFFSIQKLFLAVHNLLIVFVLKPLLKNKTVM